MRAVFDTDVLVSALVFGGRLRWLRQAWAAGTVTPIVCRKIVAELLRVLTYPKFRLEPAEQKSLLSEYLPFAETAVRANPLPELPLSCRDRDDIIFIHLAISTGVDLLVSGDADLADLTALYPVVSPPMLRLRLEQKG